MHAQRGHVLIRADEKPGRHDDAVVVGLGIDVLHPVDALDDVFQGPRDKLDRLVGLVAVGPDENVDHGHADLRLLLARQRDERDCARDERGHQQERPQRRIDEDALEDARNAELHGALSSSPS